MNAAFPGLLGRRVRLVTDDDGTWRGYVVGWDDGYVVVEAEGGRLELYGWRGPPWYRFGRAAVGKKGRARTRTLPRYRREDVERWIESKRVEPAGGSR